MVIAAHQEQSKWILFYCEKDLLYSILFCSVLVYSILFYIYFYLGMILFKSCVTDTLLGC